MYRLRQAVLAGILICTLLLTFPGNILAFGSKGRVEPIFARYARTYTSPTLDIKFGVPFKLTRDGQDYAAELELTYRF